MEAVKRVFHIPQAVESCGGNVEESVENFSGKKREGQPPKPARGVPLLQLFNKVEALPFRQLPDHLGVGEEVVPMDAEHGANAFSHGGIPVCPAGCR